MRGANRFTSSRRTEEEKKEQADLTKMREICQMLNSPRRTEEGAGGGAGGGSRGLLICF